MTIRKGLPAKKAATDADDTRYDFRNDVTCNADGSPRGGVTSPIGTSLVSSTATMNVAVGAFSAVAVRDNGVVKLANEGTVNVLLDTAPAANSRIDVIYAKQNDSSSTVTTPDANDLPVITFAKGVAAASPAKPALPIGAVELATVLIPAGATATNSSSPAVVITQTAQFTAAAGGIVSFRSVTDLNLWTTSRPGQFADVYSDPTTSNNATYRWSGSAWAFVASSLVASGAIASFGTNISAGPGMDIFKLDGIVHGNLYVTKTTAIGAGEVLATLNPGWRPGNVVASATGIPNSYGLRIDGSNGQITTVGNPASTTLVAYFCFRQVN